MAGKARCNVCDVDLDLEWDVEERQPPQRPEPSYHCGYCGSDDITIVSME